MTVLGAIAQQHVWQLDTPGDLTGSNPG